MAKYNNYELSLLFTQIKRSWSEIYHTKINIICDKSSKWMFEWRLFLDQSERTNISWRWAGFDRYKSTV